MDTPQRRKRSGPEAANLPTPLVERLQAMHAVSHHQLNASLSLLKQLNWSTATLARALDLHHNAVTSRLASSAARLNLPPLDDPAHPFFGLSALLLPPWTISAAETERLRALVASSRNATSTPHGSPARQHSVELNELMHRLSKRGVTPAALARASGLPRHLVVQRLKRMDDLHGSAIPPWGVNPRGTPENVRPTDLAHRTRSTTQPSHKETP